jgi:SAM-dependent methyltransferase
MTDQALEAFYQAEYRRHVQAQEGPVEKDIRVQAGRAGSLLDFVRPEVDRVARHLDLGSSTGALLSAFQKAYGCQSFGVEPGDAYREYSRRSGHHVVPDLVDLAGDLRRGFDLVSLAHVLEHMSDPVGTLVDLRQSWLVPGGYLLAEVPNLYGHQSLELAHLTAFSRETLQETLRLAGFEVLKLKAHGRPRSRVFKLYLTVLARAESDGPTDGGLRSSPHRVRSRRRMGMIFLRVVTAALPRIGWREYPRP